MDATATRGAFKYRGGIGRRSLTRFFTAEWGEGVFHSSDGQTWERTGTGFPSANVGRIALGVQVDNPNLVYAFVADLDGGVHGVYRLDSITGNWKQVLNVPDVLPGSQGAYDPTDRGGPGRYQPDLSWR